MRKGQLVAILTLLALGLGAVLWNQSRPGAEVIDQSYAAQWQRNYRYGTPSFANPLGGSALAISPAGLITLKNVMLETTPVRNPLRILREHLRYWANSSLFPVQIRMNSETTEGWAVYYQCGRYVFLRHANPWHNAVLTIDVTTDELERLLLPHIITVRPLDPTAPAEAEPSANDRDSTRQQ